jgi:hypothetical protein
LLIRLFILVILVLAAAAATAPVVANAEEPRKVDIEAAEMVAALIGAPVFAKDGAEVGRVADIAFDGELRPKALRMVTGIPMGLGIRTLIIPKGSFIAVDGAVILDVPAEVVSAFAEIGEASAEK